MPYNYPILIPLLGKIISQSRLYLPGIYGSIFTWDEAFYIYSVISLQIVLQTIT
jgi:hypothetical protein